MPGLGFDVPHLAATCGPEAVGAGRHAQQSSFFFPGLDGGFVFGGVPGAVEEATGTEAQSSEDSEDAAPRRARQARVPQDEPVQPAKAETAPVDQSGEYLFVRRDGTVFFAVAYMWEGETLRYVTSDGLKRSTEREALDLTATEQFNEQRGLNFRLPA